MTDAIVRADLTAECAVLGAVILDNSVMDTVASIVTPDDFRDVRNVIVFDAMRALAARHAPIDTVTLAAELRARDRLQTIGGGTYLGELTDLIPTIAHVEHHARIVADHSAARRIEELAMELIQSARDPSQGANALHALAEKRLAELAARVDSRSGAIFESVSEGFEKVVNACEYSTPPLRWMTGFERFDLTMGGFYPGTLNLIAARPGVGKSSLAAGMMFNIAVVGKTPCLMLSLEMTSTSIWQRLMSAQSGVSHELIRKRAIGPNELNKMMPVAQSAHSIPFHIYVPPHGHGRPLLDSIRSLVRAFKRRFGSMAALALDYLQLAVRGGKESLVDRLGELSGGLKELSMDEEIAVIALSQLNRESAKDDTRPTMSQLRSSGSIEQDADTVTLLYRPKSTKTETVPDGRVEAIIEKNRDGATGVVNLHFTEWLTKFEEEEAADPAPYEQSVAVHDRSNGYQRDVDPEPDPYL